MVFDGGSVFGAAVSISVATIGAGILALPSIFQDSGIFFVFAVLGIVGFFTINSLDYLVLCIDRLHLRSYEDISRELLGRGFEEAVRWMIIVYTLGIAAGYIVVVGEIFTPMLPLIQPYLPFMSSKSHVMLTLWAFIMLPLSLIPRMSHLNSVSFLGIGATAFISVLIVYRYFMPGSGQVSGNATVNLISVSSKSLLAFPVLMFSFDCQTLVFQIYANLKNRSRHTMLKVSCLSIGVTAVMYSTVGIFGYISHPGRIRGNILKSYNPLKDHLFALGECIYSFAIIMAYVLVLVPCRDAVSILLYGYSTASQEAGHKPISKYQIVIMSFLLACLSLFLALRASGLVFIIALLGGLCSSTVCFIYPAAFRLAMHARGIERCNKAEYLIAVFMLVFGVVGGIAGTVIAFSTRESH